MTLDPRLVPTFVAAIAFEIFFPLVVGYYIHRRFGVRWRFFLYGALVFLLSQLITRVPLVQIIQGSLASTFQSNPTLLYVWFVVLALTAGLFEGIGRYVGYRWLVKDNKTWQVGLMYGAGHGGLESMVLVGGLALLGLINIIVLANLPPGQSPQIEAVRQQVASLDWWTPLLGAYERFITLFFHIALSILVLQTFLRGSLLWLVLAILLHAAVDMSTLILSQPSFGISLSPVWIEVVLTITLPLSLGIIYYFRPRTMAAEPLPAL